MNEDKMKSTKVVPIKGRHQSFNSMAGEAMDTKEWVRGYVIAFEEDGTMHVGEFDVRNADACMAAMELQMRATDALRREGGQCTECGR